MEVRSEKTKIQKAFDKIINIIIFILELILPIFSFIFLITTLIIYIFNEYVFDINFFNHFLEFDKSLRNIILKDKASLLVNISVVLIGFLITVMSVVGVNHSRAVVHLSKENLINKFIRYASYSLGLAFGFLLITIISSDFLTDGKSLFHFAVFITLIINAIRFSVIVMMIFKKNMDFAEEDQKKQDDLLIILRDIQNNVSHVNYNNEEYLSRLREKVEENKKEESNME